MNRLKYVWFFWMMKLTGWLPDFVPFMAFRGWMLRPCFHSCGRNLQVASRAMIVMPGRVTIGNNVYIAYGSWIQGAGGVWLDDEVMLGPYTILASSNHTSHDNSYRYGPPSTAAIRLGRGAWTGSHVTVTAGVTIGEGGACAANSVVTRDVNPGSVVAGVPATELASQRVSLDAEK
jgi:maltose O-acetyltransferase